MKIATYTYDDVIKKAKDYGLLESMSEADRNLSRTDPDAGMTILQSRYDYKTALTDDARALAHTVAERTRQQYGGYSGGADGSRFYITEKSPADFSQSEAPTFTDRYADQQAALTDQVLNRKPYASSYADQQNDLLKQVGQAYDPAKDPLYSAYAKQYRREGSRAAADALGQAASLTGGVPSTAAATAATQAGQYYATQLSDKIPELAAARQTQLLNALAAVNEADNTAYQRYLNDAALDYDNIELLRALRSDDYTRYRDALAQHNTDRDFAYGQYLDDLEYHQNLDANELAQKNYEDELAWEKQQYNDALAQSREEYQQQLQAINDEQLWTAALYALEYFNDSSLLKKLIEQMKGDN